MTLLSLRNCRAKASLARTIVFLPLFATLGLAAVPALAQSAEPVPAVAKSAPCPNAADLVRFHEGLPVVARKVAAGLPVTIVAIGSSSTAGAGASNPAAAYPARLAEELKQLWRGRVTVLNRGVNGEEASDMIARFDREVFAEKPDLVLWQVGTNALLRDIALRDTDSVIREGLRRLKASGSDVILVDPQYAQRVLAKGDTADMVRRLNLLAKEFGSQVFQRFALMRRWHETDRMPIDAFITSDGLHLNDWSYGCWAKTMAGAIAETVARPTATAAATPR